MAELSALGSTIKVAYESQTNTNAFTDVLNQQLVDIVANTATLTNITTSDAIDLSTALVLLNECKSKINAIIVALQV